MKFPSFVIFVSGLLLALSSTVVNNYQGVAVVRENRTATVSNVTVSSASKATPLVLGEQIENLKPIDTVNTIEKSWESDYETYFKANLSQSSLSAPQISATLGRLASQTGKRTALVYAVPTPKKLELVLVMPQRTPIRKSVPAATSENLVNTAKELVLEITDITKVGSSSYLPAARRLYQWIITPLETELKNNRIDSLIFCMGSTLRSLPLASLHDGQKFLVEKYSVGLIPAFNMTDLNQRSLKNSQILAMGASQFKELPPLIAVPVELSTIAPNVPQKRKYFLNQEFTIDNLRSQRASQPFSIVHLATHAQFNPGAPASSFIQFWDSRLTLDRMRQLQWNNPPVDLLVLSACRTAIGDKDAEMGFAGVAIQSGTKSTLASLWNVSDMGTLALMSEFYRYLKTAPTRSEALRQAQTAMLRGEVRLEKGKLIGPNLGAGVTLPPSLVALGNQNFKHPYFWSGFTMIGNNW
ncbi:CHAT domain-containing protein [Phormidium sp. LEGE 05292]|uniref:CHAT domain-containing protein n=1 Tax=[Phormidium] sp. LEGE 05292 TaxID=767427 RepID=UPI00187F877D|nr:CHAT domain-containing protein [Phormidium sp. LEGE 05292]MBE9228538.1 CHAT domain-containing protein [Phormidium sp. LEGE 05292]